MLITSGKMTIHLDMIRHRAVYYRSTRLGRPIMPEKMMTKSEFEIFLGVKKEDKVTEKKMDRKERVKDLFKKISLCDLNYRQEEIVQSLEEYFEERGYLSPKQEELLLSVYEQLD
jgi:hypothetical protein